MNNLIIMLVLVLMYSLTGMSQNTVTNNSKGNVSILFSDDKSSETYERSKDKLAVITVESDNGDIWKGSGFILKGKNSNWLITNAHVVSHPGRIMARLLSGRKIELGKMGVAENRDIARFEVHHSYPALDMDVNEPIFGDEIEVYGNSDGEDVVTRITGKVRGIGPEFVEVDARFVSGNSGSPIIRTATGKVIGVATFTKHRKHDNDSAYEMTRFNNVRWFGVRFVGVKWNEIGWDKFSRQVRGIVEIEKYIKKIEKICFDGQWFRKDDYIEMEKFVAYPSLNRIFYQIAKMDEKLFELGERLFEMEEKNLALEGGMQNGKSWREKSLRDASLWISNFESHSISGGSYKRQGGMYGTRKVGRGSIEYISQETIDYAKKNVGRVYLEGTKCRYMALNDGRSLLGVEQWCTKDFMNKVKCYKKIIDKAIRSYKDLNRRQLRKAGVRL